ncbi:serine protease [Aliarcobacter butzleri]|uniref:S1 family peptidase n=1 Tax=Aliarcobacter butzleri TaxID=28197 RepID=UPI001EDC6067|nr:serine protease [Aliarcobacter butzleri]MCG3651779.1 serine protease [Aliarcobacter butzleri]
MSKTIYEKLEINVCKILCDGDHGTGFLISNELILTAYHVVDGCDKIKVTFDNKKELDVTLHESIDYKDIAILKLDKSVEFYEYIPIVDIKIQHNTKWISRGFPSFNINSGENILEHIDNVVNGQNSLLNSNDIRLDFNQKLDTYQGFSGSPLIIDSSIVGIIKDEQLERGSAKELKALSIKYFKDLLEQLGINILEQNFLEKNIKDLLSTKRWQELKKPEDYRTLKDKILAVCNEMSDRKINDYNTIMALGREDLLYRDEREISAIKYIIFRKCQSNLIDFCDENTGKIELSKKELKEFINLYVKKAKEIVDDKRQEFNYDSYSEDFIEKIVLNLIEDCFLSFDEDGIYDQK